MVTWFINQIKKIIVHVLPCFGGISGKQKYIGAAFERMHYKPGLSPLNILMVRIYFKRFGIELMNIPKNSWLHMIYKEKLDSPIIRMRRGSLTSRGVTNVGIG